MIVLRTVACLGWGLGSAPSLVPIFLRTKNMLILERRFKGSKCSTGLNVRTPNLKKKSKGGGHRELHSGFSLDHMTSFSFTFISMGSTHVVLSRVIQQHCLQRPVDVLSRISFN